MHALLLVRLGRIEWGVGTSRIVRDAALVGQGLVVIGAIPIAAPLPNVAGHVVKAVTIRRKRFYGCNADIPIFGHVFHWKFSLPSVRHPFSTGPKFVAPYVCRSEERRVGKEFIA